jgi:hypothetical protein
VEDDDVDNELVQTFNKLVDLKLIRALKDVYCTPPPIKEDEESLYTFYIKYPIRIDI